MRLNNFTYRGSRRPHVAGPLRRRIQAQRFFMQIVTSRTHRRRRSEPPFPPRPLPRPIRRPFGAKLRMRFVAVGTADERCFTDPVLSAVVRGKLETRYLALLGDHSSRSSLRTPQCGAPPVTRRRCPVDRPTDWCARIGLTALVGNVLPGMMRGSAGRRANGGSISMPTALRTDLSVRLMHRGRRKQRDTPIDIIGRPIARDALSTCSWL
jgi:hypothetical protein